ncbi:hypothetical protein PM082_006050 [Marasmius tenuissimus]|nr:hypothetical protein PM082_006050 [Marasmius tenuissimus]
MDPGGLPELGIQGPMIVGLLLNVCLPGVVTTQCYIYATTYIQKARPLLITTDKLWIKSYGQHSIPPQRTQRNLHPGPPLWGIGQEAWYTFQSTSLSYNRLMACNPGNIRTLIRVNWCKPSICLGLPSYTDKMFSFIVFATDPVFTVSF